MFVPQLYQFQKGHLRGPALKYFHMIHRPVIGEAELLEEA